MPPTLPWGGLSTSHPPVLALTGPTTLASHGGKMRSTVSVFSPAEQEGYASSTHSHCESRLSRWAPLTSLFTTVPRHRWSPICLFSSPLTAAIKVVLFPGSLFKNGEERAWEEGCNKNRICVSAGACLVTLSSFLNPVITFDSLASCTSVPEWEVASETMCVLLTVISGGIPQWAME